MHTMVSTPEALHEVLKTVAPLMDIRKVVVYGSIARGDFTVRSDIDLVVAFQDSSKTWRDLINFDVECERLCGREVHSIFVMG